MSKFTKDLFLKKIRDDQDLALYRKAHLSLSTASEKTLPNSSEISNFKQFSSYQQTSGSQKSAKQSYSSQLAKFKSVKTKTIEEIKKERANPGDKEQNNSSALTQKIENTENLLAERTALKQDVAKKLPVDMYGAKDNQFYYDSMEIRSLNEFMFFYDVLKRIRAEKIHEDERTLFKAKLQKITELEYLKKINSNLEQGDSQSQGNSLPLFRITSTKTMPDKPQSSHEKHHFSESYHTTSKRSHIKKGLSPNPAQTLSSKQSMRQESIKVDTRSMEKEEEEEKELMQLVLEKFGSKVQKSMEIKGINQFMTMKQADIQLVELLERIRQKTKTKEDKEYQLKQKNKKQLPIQRGFKAQVINNIVDSAIHRAEKQQKKKQTQAQMIFDKLRVTTNVVGKFKKQSHHGIQQIDTEQDYEEMGIQIHQSEYYNRSISTTSKLKKEIPTQIQEVEEYEGGMTKKNQVDAKNQMDISDNNFMYFSSPTSMVSHQQRDMGEEDDPILNPSQTKKSRHHCLKIGEAEDKKNNLNNSSNSEQLGVTSSVRSIRKINGKKFLQEGAAENNYFQASHSQHKNESNYMSNNQNNEDDNHEKSDLMVNHSRNKSLSQQTINGITKSQRSVVFQQKEINKFDIEKRILKNLDKIGAQFRMQNRVNLPEVIHNKKLRAKTAEQKKRQQEKYPFKFSPNFLSNWVDLRARIETKFDIPSKFHLHKILNKRIKEIKSHKINYSHDNAVFIFDPEQNDYFL